MKYLKLIFFILAIFFALSYTQKLPQTFSIEKSYKFAKTSDSNFCNPDSIQTIDCSGGSLYYANAGILSFNKSGEVKLSFYNEDTTHFYTGHYKITKTDISCNFYTSYFTIYDSYSDKTINSIFKKDKFILNIKKLYCSKYLYGFIHKNEKYVLY